MMKQYIRYVLVSSILLNHCSNHVHAADVASDSTKVKIQRSFVNLSFNQPTISKNPDTPQLEESKVEGWLTTHPNPKQIEIWRGRGAATTNYTAWNTVNNSPTVNQYAELNASAKSALYQNVCLFNGEEFTWNFKHAARASTKEQASFYIGKVSADRFSFSQDQLIGTSQPVSSLFEWKNANPSGTKAKVSVASGIYQFIFDATAYGSNATLGNFIDDIELGLKPAVEFSAESGEVYEGDDSMGKTHTIPFNLVGYVVNQATMPSLQFKIEYPSNYTKTKAIYGKNYRLYKQTSAGLVELNSATDALNTTNPDKITFNYTPLYNSNLDYSKGVQINGLVIKVYGNTQSNGDIEIPFSFALDSNSNAIATSLSVCGDVTADVDFSFKIKEDDVDLSVVKSLATQSVIQKDSLISYTLDVANNTAIQADGVVLRDSFKNLSSVTTGEVSNQTALVCEDLTDGNTKACPASWTDNNALTALFSSTEGSGLNLGNIPANAKYKFTIKNLKVTDTDTSSLGYIVNTAVIESTKMLDINSNNNISTVKTMYAVKNDLYNNDSTNTGKNPFVVNNDGHPLWVQNADANNKVYFPLIIKNEAAIAQNYQLYHSNSEIRPLEKSPSDYSSLDKATITPFTSELKIEFYKADENQCNANNINGKQINQLNVAANTTGQVCAVITVLPSALANTNIWFAIESIQSGLGDVLLNAVTSNHLQERLLELVNDQFAQINIGGTYVFAHRLINHGTSEEKEIKLKITPVQTDNFLYTLFEDINKNGVLDSEDTMIMDQSFSILANSELSLLIKVQAPATASNGISSQVKLEAIPDNSGKTTILSILSNLDRITVASNQLQINKTQLKQVGCKAITKENVKNGTYSSQTATLGINDCLIYRITVTNTGDSRLNNVAVSDMYPAYTIPWDSGSVLPMTDSVETVQEDRTQLKAIFSTLDPTEQKSLYFGIRMQ